MQSLRAESPAQSLPADVWAQLADPVRRAHRAGVEFRGLFRVEHGRGWFVRLLARLSRLPPPAEKIDTSLLIVASAGREQWRRSFGGHSFFTTQWSDDAGRIVERWGIIEIRFRLVVREGGLRYRQAGAALRIGPLRLPLPRWLAPRVAASETPQAPDRVGVRVSVTLPLVGLLATYEGEVQT